MTARASSWVLAMAIGLGLLIPPLAAAARPLLLPAVFGLLLVALLQLEPGAPRRVLARPRLTTGIAAWQVLVVPWLTLLACRVLGLGDTLATALLVTACAGSIFSVPAFTRLLGLDDALAVAVMLVGTLLMPVALLAYAPTLLPVPVEFHLGAYLARLAVFIAGPFALAAALRHALGPARLARAQRRLAIAMVVTLVLFGLAIMDGVTARALAEPAEVGGFLAAAFAFNLGAQALTALVFLPAGLRIAATAGLLAGYRNLGLMVGVTAGLLDQAFLVFVGVWQIPMYVLPLLLAPLYRRLRG